MYRSLVPINNIISVLLSIGMTGCGVVTKFDWYQNYYNQEVKISIEGVSNQWFEGVLFGIMIEEGGCIDRKILWVDEGQFYLSDSVAVKPDPTIPQTIDYTGRAIRVCDHSSLTS